MDMTWAINIWRVSRPFAKGAATEHCLVSRRSGDEFCIFICGFQDISEIQKILKELWRKL